MNELSKTAVAFAKECLGYKRIRFMDEKHIVEDLKMTDEEFHYTDLNVVMEKVMEWLPAVLGVRFYVDPRNKAFAAQVIDFGYAGLTEPVQAYNPCAALMRACLEANLVIKNDQ